MGGGEGPLTLGCTIEPGLVSLMAPTMMKGEGVGYYGRDVDRLGPQVDIPYVLRNNQNWGLWGQEPGAL